MARAHLAVAVIGSLVGCGSPSPISGGAGAAPVTPTLVIAPSDSELPTTARHSRREAPACVVAHDDFAATQQRWGLALRGSTQSGSHPVWATLDPEEGGRATVELAGAYGEHVDATFVGGGLELATLARTEDVRLHAAKPIWFEGVALPVPDLVLSPKRADGARVTLSLDVGEDFVPETVVDEAPCEALGLVPGDYDAGALTALEGSTFYEIVGDEPVPLFAEPEGGSSGLALALGAGSLVRGAPGAGPRRRVIVWQRHVTVVGWAPEDRLVETRRSFGTGSTGGTGFMRPGYGRFALHQRRDYRCPSRVPLWARLGDQSEQVGVIAAGGELFVNPNEPPRDGMQRIYLDDAPIHLQGGASLAVTTRALSGCQVQP